MKCKYLVAADEAYRLGPDGSETPVIVKLCAWGDSAPQQLMDAPRWLQRNALSGHLWRDGDCEGCPAFVNATPG